MRFTIRPATRSEAKPLVGLYSESGKGKTYSALLLARGFVGAKGKIVMIETESGRGEVYADELPGGYEVLSLRDEFSPTTYGEAITAAEKAGADALIIDSASHEWEGLGGVLDMAARNQASGKKGPLVWQKPKIDHAKHFMLRLMQTPIPIVIVCMRAKYVMVEGKNPKTGKKEWHRSQDLSPKQSEDILYEMMVHGWIDGEHRFHGTKYTTPDLKTVMPSGQPISEETGRALAVWAAGDAPKEAPAESGGPTLEEILKSIGMAQSIGELETIGPWIKKAGLKDAQLKEARELYGAKQAELKGGER